MQLKLVFVEANTTGTGMIALRLAQTMGVTPVFLTQNPDRYLGLDETGAEVVICDTNDFQALVQTIETHVRAEEIAGICTTSDFYLGTVAKLTDRYGLLGNPPEVIETCRDKAKTRICLQQNNVRQPRFVLLESLEPVYEAVDAIGLPCVLKPVDDSGSNNVKLCHTHEEAMSHAQQIWRVEQNVRGQKASKKILVEEYVNAPEYSVEMFTWEGKTRLIGITQKTVIGEPYFTESMHTFPAPLPPEQQQEIEAVVTEALQAVGFAWGASHTEVKLTAEGCVLIEINPRLAGGMIPELIRLVTGLDLLELQVKATHALDVVPEVQVRCVAGIRFLISPQSGTFRQVAGVERAQGVLGIYQVQVTGKTGQTVQFPPPNAYHRLGFMIATGETVLQVEECLEEASSWLELQVDESTNQEVKR
ncbi:MAG: ATP-grasp domain-containing protein [Tumebacillaceae bacterium]